MELFVKDVRYSLSTLLRSPGFTIPAVAALALGIGANTALFSVVNTVLLRPMPFPDPDRIVQFTYMSPGGVYSRASEPAFNVWRQQRELFEEVSGYRYISVNLTGVDHPEQLQSAQVTGSFFRLFGASIVHGRSFTSEEDRPGARHVVVLSYGFWQRRYGGDSHAVGKSILLSGTPYEIIGVLAAGFNTEVYPLPDVWIPFQIDTNSNAQNRYFSATGRLRRGVTLDSANAQLHAVTEEFRRKFPGAGATVLGPQERFGVELLRDSTVGDVRSPLSILVVTVSFVLLIACANVANLLLARGTSRQHEFAIRISMGASHDG